MLYLYAIVARPPSLAGMRGVRAEPLFVIHAAELYAVVGEADGPPESTRDRLVAHHEVVTRLAATQAALPARFGQLAKEDAIAADLRTRAPMLREALALIDGCVQMTLRIGVDGAVAAGHDSAPAFASDEGLATSAAHLPPSVQDLRRALSSTVRAEKVRLHEGEAPFASLYHLVPKALVDEWARALEKERARTGAKIAATGPWPVYAFAPVAA